MKTVCPCEHLTYDLRLRSPSITYLFDSICRVGIAPHPVKKLSIHVSFIFWVTLKGRSAHALSLSLLRMSSTCNGHRTGHSASPTPRYTEDFLGIQRHFGACHDLSKTNPSKPFKLQEFHFGDCTMMHNVWFNSRNNNVDHVMSCLYFLWFVKSNIETNTPTLLQSSSVYLNILGHTGWQWQVLLKTLCVIPYPLWVIRTSVLQHDNPLYTS